MAQIQNPRGGGREMSLFGLFGKKRFGLKEALVVVDKKPDITPDGAKTGAAFVEALGLPVTVVAEAEAEIVELETSLIEMEEGIHAAKAGIKDVEEEDATLIGSLKADLKATIEAIERVISKKVDKIEEAAAKKIAALYEKINRVNDVADIKGDNAIKWGENLVAKTTKEMNKKIIAAENKMAETIGGLKIQIADLELETEAAKAELGTLGKIKSLFA
jgi:hypothetical protein